MTEIQVNEAQARDAALEAEERLHESRRSFLKSIGAGAAVTAAGLGGMTVSAPTFGYGGPYRSAFVLERSHDVHEYRHHRVDAA